MGPALGEERVADSTVKTTPTEIISFLRTTNMA